ncbi:IclR family transcriptional regulator domain-containing protein [Acidovorax sp. RAC01]|uniref:IclR family transcriptional regulator domain-containing protein n=1 Tax=Acidovorax sp. RAC01 TaxID=1842533 RepID=UPI00083E85BC|nr:IclR family transcriptional regulator C-terminal domain-containing protein [Acidovorax sp. RAC01]AOG23542.1 beta-ketoadipate pathway transcriptional regulator, PcaR/PcaU/PobR family protein [Acidovorax sp. RAC01]
MTSLPIAKSDLIEGMARGMAVLESFDTERQRLNATLAAQRTGLTRAAARRHLLTLAHLGYLETDGSYFWLAPKVLRLSGSYLASARLPRVLQPTLNRLAAQTQQSFSAVVLDGGEVVIVARSGGYGAPARLLAYGVHLGARLPAHPTSTGRVLLAALLPAELTAWLKAHSLHRLTPHTITQVGPLRQVISQVRRDDFCLAAQEHELDVLALAVPLRNLQGRTVAALNVVASPRQIDAGSLQRDMLPLLQEAVRELRGLL